MKVDCEKKSLHIYLKFRSDDTIKVAQNNPKNL